MSKNELSLAIPVEQIEQCIYVVRGHRVMLDRDLAELYEVETGAFNRAIKRNIERFPIDFAFQLTQKELENLICQIGISRSWGGYRKLPWVFTEQGLAMLSGLLHSSQAVAVNIEIMRAFVRMRHVLASQQQVTKELIDIKSFLLKHTNSSDREFRRVWRAIEKLSGPPDSHEQPIGFDLSR